MSKSKTSASTTSAVIASPTRRDTNTLSQQLQQQQQLPDPVALLDSLDHLPSRTVVPGNTTTRRSFDPIEFLNAHYDTESRLSQQLPALRDAVDRRMNVLEERISNAMTRQSETARNTLQNVETAKMSVVALQQRVLQVQQKAAESERAVFTITAEMKRLDCAKQHLQKTITTLKQLHMLVHAVEQLRVITQNNNVDNNNADNNRGHEMTPTADFTTASHLLSAIAQFMEHFEPYISKVEPMRILNQKVIQYRTKLQQRVVITFRVVAFGTEKATLLQQQQQPKQQAPSYTTAQRLPNEADISLETLNGGILLIDALGETTRQQFIHNFCQDLLGDYVQQFQPPDHRTMDKTNVTTTAEKRISSFKVAPPPPPETKDKTIPKSSLSQMEQRCHWFLNGPLKLVQDKFPKVFPEAWNVQAKLATLFLQLTRDHILALIEEGPRKDPEAQNATVLLKALQKIVLFEKDMTSWLERECQTKFLASDTTKTLHKKSSSEPLQSKDETTPPSVPPLVGVASVAFQNYMDPYIRLEEQTMDEQLAEALEDRTVDTRGERPVFISSTNLFVYIKGSITRCTALTKGNAFFQLYRAYQSSLKNYARILNGKLPAPSSVAVGGIVIAPFVAAAAGKPEANAASSSAAAAANASYRIPPGEEITVCHVISTCEYCADTMEALEDLIRDTIDNEYKHKIDMMNDQEQFHDIIAKAIRVLVSGLTNRLEGAFKSMSTIHWGTVDAVGEESPYVLTIHEETEPFFRTVRSLLPTSYYRNFCDKFVMAFTNTYFETLTRIKRISEPGTQQLLLDLYNIKTLFLKLPVLDDTGASIAPAMYTKTVQKQFGRIEKTLKMVGTPNDLLIEQFKTQWPDGSVSDFTTVMTLKGMKRIEQVPMLEKFGFDPASALKGVTAGVTSAAIVSERVQQLQDQGSTVAAKVNSDLNQMRQKVDDFRKTFR